MLMKIKYDMSKNYLKCYNEALGVATHKKKIFKNHNSKTHTYTYYGWLYLGIVILIILINYISYITVGYGWINHIMSYLDLLILLAIIIYFILFGIRCYYSRCRLEKGTFCFDEEGIKNDSYMGIEMLFRWNKIKYIVVKKYSITILTDTPVFFFMNIETKEELIKGIQKYKKDIEVIENK